MQFSLMACFGVFLGPSNGSPKGLVFERRAGRDCRFKLTEKINFSRSLKGFSTNLADARWR